MAISRHALVAFFVLPLIITLCTIFPRYTSNDDDNMYMQYLHTTKTIHVNGSSPNNYISFPVMTFNIRLDGEESDFNNHFTKRVDRLSQTIIKWNPSIIGLQEPFAGQLLHLQSKLPRFLKEIGFHRDTGDLGHPSRHNDFQVGMLYNSNELELIAQDYIWLSKTPRKENSKNWDSQGIRTLNIAHFQLKLDRSVEIIAFNTHLDAWGEEARREQSKIVLTTIKTWHKKYPHAVVVLFGDFNTAPGQAAHKTLTSYLNDAWVECKSDGSCISNSFSSTFHGWFGAIFNTYSLRFTQLIAFCLHGMGVTLPHHIPKSASEYIQLFKDPWRYPLSEGLPLWPFDRFHVDWILYKDTLQEDVSIFDKPNFVSVVDVRSANFSSDHFPVVALFKIPINRKNHE